MIHYLRALKVLKGTIDLTHDLKSIFDLIFYFLCFLFPNKSTLFYKKKRLLFVASLS